jgi:hypothetical protein
LFLIAKIYWRNNEFDEKIEFSELSKRGLNRKDQSHSAEQADVGGEAIKLQLRLGRFAVELTI